MAGFIRALPARVVFDEAISSGVGQKTGIAGWTAQGAFPRYNSWATPIAVSSSFGANLVAIVLAGTTSGPTLTAQSTSAGAGALGQPDYPRTLRVYPSTSAYNGAASSSNFLVINGTNQFNQTVAESISMGNGPGPIDGTVAFRTITSIVIPAASSAGTPFTIVLGPSFGLDRTPLSVASVITGALNGTAETTRGLICPPASSGTSFPAATAAATSKATFKFNGSPTSSAGALLEVYFMPQDTLHI